MFHQEDKRQLKDLFRRVGAKGDVDAVFSLLNRKYGERHRAYHNAAHIRHCLDEFRPVRQDKMPRDPNAIEMAIWFHDAVYTPRRTDNESRSVKLAQEVLSTTGGLFEHPIIERVSTLIMATKHGMPLSMNDPDAIMMADIDLSPLGISPDSFDENLGRLQREFRMEFKKFLERQAWFLKKLCKGRHIFGTEYFQDRYERPARSNIDRIARRAGII